MASNYTPYSLLKKQQQVSANTSRYQSRNEPPSNRTQIFTTTTRNVGLSNPQRHMTMFQKQQIADLQRKIDLILMHNEKLQSEKERYRLLVEQLTNNTDRVLYTSHTARFATEQNQIIIAKLRKQLQLSSKTYQLKLNEAYESRQIIKKQIQTLSRIVQQLSQQNKSLRLQLQQKGLKEQSMAFKLKEQFIRQQAQLQNQLRDQFLMKQIDYKNEKSELKDNYEKEISELIEHFKQEKKQLQVKQNQNIENLKDEHKRQQKRIVQSLKDEFQKEKQIINEKNQQNMRKQKTKAMEYIQTSLQNVKSNDEQIKKQYEYEIESLKNSLQSRKKLIQTLLTQNNNKQNIQNEQQLVSTKNNSWFNELIALKEELKNLTNSFLRQSQLLKLKMSEKHQIDIKELKKIYENKIQLMHLQIDGIQEQNSRLRDLYEQSLNKKINLKKQFQLERSNLKNLIRKLKVELNGIQQEFRINIQGVRDQNNTFSMTMMKSMVEVKDKANFFAEQNRKLRKAFDQHEKQLVDQKKLSQQKLEYYKSQYQSLKSRTNSMIADFKETQQTLQIESEERQNQLRQNSNKKHEMMQSLTEELKQQNNQLYKQNDDLKRKKFQIEALVREKEKDAEYFRSRSAQLEADIQKLKIDLQMSGINDKDKTDTINQWKSHYESIIKNVEEEKQILNYKLQQKDGQLAEIVKKYKTLQFQLEKVVKTLKKRSDIQRKVMQIGMDENIIKNLAEIFSRDNSSNNPQGQPNQQTQ